MLLTFRVKTSRRTRRSSVQFRPLAWAYGPPFGKHRDIGTSWALGAVGHRFSASRPSCVCTVHQVAKMRTKQPASCARWAALTTKPEKGVSASEIFEKGWLSTSQGCCCMACSTFMVYYFRYYNNARHAEANKVSMYCSTYNSVRNQTMRLAGRPR